MKTFFFLLLSIYLSSVLAVNRKDLDENAKLKERPNVCEEKTKFGSRIGVNYKGYLYRDNSLFDSNEDPEHPFVFTLGKGQVIKGWEQGLTGMCVGEKRKLVIPSHLAYGDLGFGTKIPGGATLIFEVQLVKIMKL